MVARALSVSVTLALAALALALPTAPAAAQDDRAGLLAEIEREVMCPVCGIPLELAHEAPQARQQRRLILDLIDEGRTKDEIKDVLVAEYGEEVLAVPGTSGFDLTAWLVPGIALVVAAVAILVGLRRWRRETVGADGGASAEAGQAEPLDPEEARRLDADIGRYRL